MNNDIDKDYLLDTLRACVEVESPVGYYREAHEWLREELAEMGYEMTVDNRACAYVRVPGRSAEKTVCLGAHLDTIGLVVRGFNADGTLRVRQLGGINYHSIEGETCVVHCRDGRAVAGQVICDHHSTHVFADARERERTEDTMAVSLVADVSSPEDARALGVTEGAVAGIDPHFERFDNGYVISRHIDDKAAVAVLLDVLRWLAATGERPAFDTLFAFPIYEEIGRGGSWVPPEVSEYVAIDITLIGPDYAGSDEHSVGVICSDAKGPYELGPHQHPHRLRRGRLHARALEHPGLLPLLHRRQRGGPARQQSCGGCLWHGVPELARTRALPRGRPRGDRASRPRLRDGRGTLGGFRVHPGGANARALFAENACAKKNGGVRGPRSGYESRVNQGRREQHGIG